MSVIRTPAAQTATRPASAGLTFGRLLSHRYLFPLPTVLVVVLMMVFPVAYTIYLSFHTWFASSLTAPTFVGLENYVQLITADTRFHNAVARTFYFTGLALVLQTVLGVALALLLNREFVGRGVVRTILLLPMMATPVAIALVWMMILDPATGLLNYLLRLVGLPGSLWAADPRTAIPTLVLVDTWQWTPLITLLVMAGLATLPREPYESAHIDGANAWQIFTQITLPLLRPTIIVAVLFRAIDVLKTFDIIYVITQGGPAFASETLNVYAYNEGLQYFHMGYASAVLVLFFTIVLGVASIFIIVRRSA